MSKTERPVLESLKPGAVFICNNHPDRGVYLVLENKDRELAAAWCNTVITLDLETGKIEKNWNGQFVNFSVLVW